MTYVPERKRKTILFERHGLDQPGGLKWCGRRLTPAREESGLWLRRRRHCGRL